MRLLSQVFANFSQFPSSEDLVHWDTRKKTEEKVIYLLGGVSLTNACLECRDVVMLWDVLFNMWFHCIKFFFSEDIADVTFHFGIIVAAHFSGQK